MTCLFVLTNSALNRGMNTGLENLAWGLAERGVQVHILCGGKGPKTHNYKIPENVPYHFTGVSGNNPASFLPLFRKIVAQHRIDAVVGWIINTALIAQEDCAKELAFFANLGQMPPRSILLRFIKGVMLRKMGLLDAIKVIGAIRKYPKATNGVVSISRTAQNASISAYQLSSEQCAVIPRGIDTDMFAYKERQSSLNKPVEILFAGNISDGKGVGELADALTFVNTPLILRLCGRAQPNYINHLKAKVDGSSHQIVYMGPQGQRELIEHYHYCDMFVFPSHSEGLGKALLEAMSCGCPVVCSDIPAFKEIVQDGNNGLMVPVRSPEAIAGAIQRYLENHPLRKNCSVNARKTIEDQFSKKHEIDSWMNLLKEQNPKTFTFSE